MRPRRPAGRRRADAPGGAHRRGPALTPEPWPRRIARWLAHVAVLWGTLCLITLPTALPTVAIWAGVALIAATVADRVLGLGEVTFRPRARWLLRCRRLPGAVLADTWLLVRRLAGRTTGASRFAGVAFPSPGEDDRAVARRVLAEAVGSAAPNVFTLGVDRDEEVLVVHQLVPREGLDDDADPLGLRDDVGAPAT